MRVSLIISTYDNPAALRLCLLGVLAQSRLPDEIVIADDGSSAATAAVLRQPTFATLPIRHAWHPDRGWRKSKVMNLAIALSTGEYLVGMDGDCIPRRDFVASHLRHARPRTFLSGTLIRVPAAVHSGFTDSDVVAINGFDETFVYGKEDRELGVRLRNAGIASRWLKYSLIVLHLDHPRSLVDLDRYREQRRRLLRLWFSGTTRIEPGIDTAIARGATESTFPVDPVTPQAEAGF